ncbi:MAG: YHYH protein [Cyanobacteria bacterium SBLK]|nr:YHYH protein [Cyanobacteria bacterium SBLK]
MILVGLKAKISPAIRERSQPSHDHSHSHQSDLDHSHEKRVNIKTEGNYRIIESDGIPDHQTGQFPNRGNPHSISSQNHSFRVPLNPKQNNRPTSGNGMLFGVAVNGIPFEPGTAEYWTASGRRSGGRGAREADWNYEALSGQLNLGIDGNNAHVQPGGMYHYHGLPEGLIDNLGGDLQLVGYAADGFPIYGAYGYQNAKDPGSGVRKMRSSYRLKSGRRSGGPNGTYDGTFTQDFEYIAGLGDLDECNGRVGITPEYPQGIYHYYITEEFPFVSRCFRGIPDRSFRKGPPSSGGGRNNGQQRPDRRDRPYPPPRRRPGFPPQR